VVISVWVYWFRLKAKRKGSRLKRLLASGSHPLGEDSWLAEDLSSSNSASGHSLCQSAINQFNNLIKKHIDWVQQTI